MAKLTKKQIRKLTKQAESEIVLERYQKAFLKHHVATLKVLRDEHGFGKKRLVKFISDVMFQVGCLNSNYVTTNELLQTIYDETGFDFAEYITRKYVNKEDVD